MKGLEMVKCESLRINMFRITHTGKSVNFPVTGLSQLGVVVSFVGKDQLSWNLYQKIARYCDILQRFCILKRFGGNSESL